MALGTIKSHQDHPISLTYKGENLILSPRQTLDNVDFNDLGPLPPTISFIPKPDTDDSNE